MSQNVIVVPTGQGGLWLERYYGQIEGNTIIGANVGIVVSSSSIASIAKNNLSNNGTGIFLSDGTYTVSWNTITLSGTAAINLYDCPGGDSLVEHNTIFGAPVSIANVGTGDTVKNNIINDAGAPTVCP